MFRHGATYAGHPTCCAAALANLDILEREGLIERVAELEPVWSEKVHSLADHPLVAEVRGGTGVLGALELDPERLAANPGLVGAVTGAARDRGVLIRPMLSSLGFSPPLTFAEEHLDLLTDAVRGALDTAR